MKTYIKRARDERSPTPLPQPGTISQVDPAVLASLLGIEMGSNVYLSETSAGGIPALSAGVDKVANACAAMLTQAQVYNGVEQIPSPLIVSRPSPLFGSFELYSSIVRTLMMRGNYIALITSYDSDGNAEQFAPIHPDAVTLDTTSGYPVYEVEGVRFDYNSIFHVRSHAPVGGLWGRGIIERYRTALSGQLYEQNFGLTSFKSGAVPTAVVQLDTKLPTQEQVDAVNSSWQSAHGGGTRKPLVTGTALNITPLSWSPHDAEFIEAKKLSIAEAALLCGLRPEDLGAAIGGQGLTYGNRSDDSIQRIIDSYTPWTVLVEQALGDLLPVGVSVRARPEALLRMSVKEELEIELLRQQVNAGQQAPAIEMSEEDAA
jgi:phage portal protein BeeE